MKEIKDRIVHKLCSARLANEYNKGFNDALAWALEEIKNIDGENQDMFLENLVDRAERATERIEIPKGQTTEEFIEFIEDMNFNDYWDLDDVPMKGDTYVCMNSVEINTFLFFGNFEEYEIYEISHVDYDTKIVHFDIPNSIFGYRKISFDELECNFMRVDTKKEENE